MSPGFLGQDANWTACVKALRMTRSCKRLRLVRQKRWNPRGNFSNMEFNKMSSKKVNYRTPRSTSRGHGEKALLGKKLRPIQGTRAGYYSMSSRNNLEVVSMCMSLMDLVLTACCDRLSTTVGPVTARFRHLHQRSKLFLPTRIQEAFDTPHPLGTHLSQRRFARRGRFQPSIPRRAISPATTHARRRTAESSRDVLHCGSGRNWDARFLA